MQSDIAIGMSKETADHIFEPFFTTKTQEQGTGLGLALCASIVAAHGGQIDVESTLGVGTTFRVRLPLDTGLTLTVDARNRTASRQGQRQRRSRFEYDGK